MAYKGKSNTGIISNTNNSKSFNTKYTGTAVSCSKTSSKNTKPNNGFNSGTSCKSEALTFVGKSTTIRTVKNSVKDKNFTSEVSVNNSNLSSKNARTSKEFNSGTPCISTAFTPSGKPSAIRTVKLSQKDKTFTSQMSVNASNSPPYKDLRSSKDRSCISRPYVFRATSLENINSKKNAGKLKDFILRKHGSISMPSPFNNTSSNKKFNSDTSYTSKEKPNTDSEKSSAVRTVKSTLKVSNFNPQTTFNKSKSSFKRTTSNKELNSYTSCTSKNMPNTSSEKSSAASTVKNTLKENHLIPEKKFYDSKFPFLKDTISNSAQNHLMGYYTSLEQNSAVITQVNSVNHQEFSSDTPTKDSISSPLKETRSNKEFNSDTPCASKAIPCSEKPSAVNTVTNSVEPSNCIPQKTFNDSKDSSEKASAVSTAKNIEKSNYFISQESFNDSKSANISSEKSSAVSTATKSVETNDFIPQNTLNDSKASYTSSEKASAVSTARNIGKSNYFIPQESINDSKSANISSEKLFAMSAATKSVESNDFIPSDSLNDSKSLPLKNTTSNSAKQRLMRYYNFLETKSAILTGDNIASPNDFIPENPVNTTLSPVKDTMYDTVHQSTFNNLYSPLRKSSYSENKYSHARGFNSGFVIANEKEIESGSSQVHPRVDRNRSSSNVDLLRCIICTDKERSIVFQPCGHLVVCRNCANNVDGICPMCRKRIKKKITAYIN